jgi:hypothetical protein
MLILQHLCSLSCHRDRIEDIRMHDSFSKCGVHAVVSWVSGDFFGGLHVDSMEGVAGFYCLADGGHGVVEEDWVFPVAVWEETAGETGVSWGVAFALACGTPAGTHEQSVLV